VRDLAWTCFSPPLVHIAHLVGANSPVSAYTPQFTPARALWLKVQDDDPAPLLKHLAMRPTHRLGVYFEQLWHFFLQHDPATELIAHNLAVRDGGKTLGEFDCILYDKQQRCYIHLELAVKFFLGVPQAARKFPIEGSALDWLGPDQKDRLATKLDQLLLRQILLTDAPAARALLGGLAITDITQQIALKGYLFQAPGSSLPLPPGYNADCPLGCWVPLGDELARHCAQLAASTFVILPKRRWLSAAYSEDNAEQLAPPQLNDAVAEQLGSDGYPLLVAALDKNGEESSRFFVTPRSWPESAS